MTTLYGIKNCDTIKKAKKWLDANHILYQFHDYRADGIQSEWLKNVLTHLDWQIVLNKRGTTFRQLDDELKNNINEQNVVDLLLEYPAMIKRPILEVDGNWYIGFKDSTYQEIFNK